MSDHIKKLFLAPDGSDLAAGTPDQPLLTLEKALAEKPDEIELAPGVYPMENTLFIHSPVKIHGNGEAVLDGGIHLHGEPGEFNNRKGIVFSLPERVDWIIDQFFVNGKRKTRAMFPKHGAMLRAVCPEGIRLKQHMRHFFTNARDFEFARIDPRAGVEVLMTHLWVEERFPFSGYDPQSSRIDTSYNLVFEPAGYNTEYRLENLPSALEEPGEYYHDPVTSKLYYLPERGETADKIDAVIPGIGAFVIAEGEDVRLENLRFLHGGAFRPAVHQNFDFHLPSMDPIRNYAIPQSWVMDSTDSPLRFGAACQSAVQMPGCITFHHAKHCSVSKCSVRNSGWYGLLLASGCEDISVRRNEFAFLGAGGIYAGGASAQCLKEKPAESVRRCVMTDNHIHDNGNVQLSACGILLTHAAGNLLEHNHIHDLYYTGISVGWNWGFAENATSENRIGWNLIHDIGKGVLSDMGGIYTLGIQPGTRIDHNHIFNVEKRYYGGWGIYPDEGSSHLVIENNLCHDCSISGFHQHYGRENIVRNNIFAFGKDCCVAITSGYNRADMGYSLPGRNYTANLIFYGNVFIAEDTPFWRLGNMPEIIWKHGALNSDNNWFLDLSHGKKQPFVSYACDKVFLYSKKQWIRDGLDGASHFEEDPGFRNLEKRDFRLKKSSPLYEKLNGGNFSDAGIRNED